MTSAKPPALAARQRERRDREPGPVTALLDGPASRQAEPVETKLALPRMREGDIRRAGLVNRLRTERGARVVLIAAPPGYGKTTLVADWARRDGRAFAWHRVEEGDAAAFAAALADAIAGVRPIAAGERDMLARRGRPDETVALLSRLLASTGEPVVLAIDDVDRLGDPESIDLLARLVDELPAGSQIAIITRAAPPLPLGRLRARGELMELGADDLRFTDREAAALLRNAGADLDRSEVGALNAAVEGWAAGLYIAALALRSGAELAEPARAGVDAMLDYFRADLLSRLGDDELRLLTRCSALERLCGPLCDAVAELQGSGALLERLEQSNLFLTPLDRERRWYRIHSVFRELLAAELERREPGLAATLRRRAASWSGANGDLGRALEYARLAGDVDQLIELVERSSLPFAATGRPEQVALWLQTFDDDALLEQHPAAAAIGALSWAMTGHADAADRWADAAGRAAAADAPLRPLLRALMCPTGPDEMRADADLALGALPLGSVWRAPTLLVLGSAYALAGDSVEAESLLREAAETASLIGAAAIESVALGCQSLLAAEDGHWQRADALAEAARERVRGSHLEDEVTSLFAFAASARAALRHGDLSLVRSDLERAAILLPNLTHAIGGFSVLLRLEFARVYLALGDSHAAGLLLDEVERIFFLRPRLGVYRSEAGKLRAELRAHTRRGSGSRSTLTAAELRLLPLLTTHLSFREIAERLYVSRNTVKTQAISVYRKLGVSCRGEAIARASGLGLVAPGGGAEVSGAGSGPS